MLTIVTVCFNNPKELEKTVNSVLQQTVAPDTYVVVDSSDSNTKPAMQAIARAANANYEWVPPEGVYPAMQHSMGLVDNVSWVWWLNSSDWLAGKKSVEIVKGASTAHRSSQTHWFIGELLRVQRETTSSHRLGSDGEEFVKLLRSGRIGFPHPSTIFRAASLAKVRPYSDPFRIASDYSTALRFAKAFGPPTLIPASLTFHDPTGLTSRHPIRNTWEKSRARQANGSGFDAVKELWQLPASGFRGLTTRFVGEKLVTGTRERSTHFPLWDNEPLDQL